MGTEKSAATVRLQRSQTVKKGTDRRKMDEAKICANVKACKEKEIPSFSPCSFYKEKIRIVMRILIGIFLLSADPLSTVPMYADENGSANSALFFDQPPSVSK